MVEDTGKGGGWLNVHYFKEKNDVEQKKTIVSMTKTKKCVQCGNLFVTGRKKKCNTEKSYTKAREPLLFSFMQKVTVSVAKIKNAI